MFYSDVSEALEATDSIFYFFHDNERGLTGFEFTKNSNGEIAKSMLILIQNSNLTSNTFSDRRPLLPSKNIDDLHVENNLFTTNKMLKTVSLVQTDSPENYNAQIYILNNFFQNNFGSLLFIRNIGIMVRLVIFQSNQILDHFSLYDVIKIISANHVQIMNISASNVTT